MILGAASAIQMHFKWVEIVTVRRHLCTVMGEKNGNIKCQERELTEIEDFVYYMVMYIFLEI